MNRLVIPSILAATVLVAGFVAFMPVEKASTVHTTIAANVEDTPRSITVTTDTDAAEADNEIIDLGTGDAFAGQAILSSAGDGACALQDESDTALLTGATNAVTVGAFNNDNSAGGGADGITDAFDDGEDIELDTPADTACYLTIVVSEWES